jgi:hypothetical protein
LAICNNSKLISSSFLNPTSDSEGWSVAGAKSAAYDCSGVKIFGGFDIFGAGTSLTKNIENLPLHNALQLRL